MKYILEDIPNLIGKEFYIEHDKQEEFYKIEESEDKDYIYVSWNHLGSEIDEIGKVDYSNKYLIENLNQGIWILKDEN